MANVLTALPSYGFLILCLALVTGTEAAGLVTRPGRVARPGRPARPGRVALPPETVFNVRSFGAKGNGRNDDWQAFARTWQAACHHPGRAKVFVPSGAYLLGPVIFQGPCSSRFPIVVQIKGTLLAQTDLSLYTSEEWILFENINGLTIIGGGTLDGQGKAAWKYSDCEVNDNCQRMPMGVRFNRVTNGIVRKLSSVNPKGFHISVNYCNNLRLYNLRLIAPADSPNTDGIHISRSNLIKIARSEIGTGDDCIGMIQGSTNISVKRVVCGPGHGISIGSLGKYPDEEDVRNIIVRNITFTGTDNGVRIKTFPKSPPSLATGIIFDDVIMNGVKNPIIIDQLYNYRGKSQDQVAPSRVQISNVFFTNIRGTSISQNAINVVCSKAAPCQNLRFTNINLKFTPILGGFKALDAFSTCVNTRGNAYAGIQIPRPTCT
ncbi:hypothetical protein MLD38_020550 [Melastoma candidum]|uniref:Uncharacterized protein n=1 Tax=Melastoma candidum TaxID=119954 RepID=A0ACB9QDS8_9MYRT|nr:hypothetical protein MLD38_020550 [Melastoma candidum]